MKRATKYKLTNQNSLFAGFTPKLSLSTEKSPFTNAKKSLLIEYHLFVIYRKKISPRGDSFPPRRDLFPPRRDSFSPRGDSFPPRRDSFSPRGDLFPPRRDSFSPRGDLFPPRRDSFPPWGEWWKMNRKLFVTINKDCLLRNKAFASGYKAIIFVRTLFRKWKTAFPISYELFRQRDETSSFGKNCMVLN